ncbi:Ger(x)C family spore germination protein [Clostridium ganghwense]|uniref:Ger(X)C family spore germination protein n=1 Tax=Clostridium ganghwense TaxID=312089 RepID=A0ABT4CPN4_9CLOT|nr:Ger(x)C family spore germination protein [Clostridium ganghwense]MCY6371019.1 Ger(x)C family spore germination protein [Clostridium ganghwense]
MNYKKFLVILFFCLGIYIFYTRGINFVPAEELAIPSTIGFDITQEDSGEIKFSIPIAVYNFTGEATPSTLIQTGVGKTIGDTREDRQAKADLKFILGLEKIIIWGEAAAQYGLEPEIDILFANPNVNDTGLNAVCKGDAMDILKSNVEGYPNPGDYLSNVIKHATEFNFFSDNYKLMDIYVRIGAEGRSLVLPYIEIKDKKPAITGIALFVKDKMVKKIGMKEAKILNLLKVDNVKGILSLGDNSKEYIDYYATSKKKVKCEKVKDKYTFYIDLSLTGDITNNNLYEDIANNPDMAKKFEGNMNKKVEQMCYEFIDKMQNEYKIDCLGLGRVAAAKYGRHTGTDWNKAVSEADIVVKVKTKIDRFGRGDY